jgi:hypothetical protein
VIGQELSLAAAGAIRGRLEALHDGWWGVDGLLSIAEVDALGDRFRPWRTLAAVYLLRT